MVDNNLDPESIKEYIRSIPAIDPDVNNFTVSIEEIMNIRSRFADKVDEAKKRKYRINHNKDYKEHKGYYNLEIEEMLYRWGYYLMGMEILISNIIENHYEKTDYIDELARKIVEESRNEQQE